MHEMVFACLASPASALGHAKLLLASLRTFGGRMSEAPFLALVPLNEPYANGLLGRPGEVRVCAYPLAQELAGIPLSERAAGAARAELAAEGLADLLVWLDSDTLVLGEPASLRIPPTATIGCRPVDLALIGSGWEGAPDPFWQGVYGRCGVDPRRVYPVRTTVDGETIRAYFNAGCLVVRPQAGLLRLWHQNLLELGAKFASLSDARQRLFFHQAVLAGTILARLREDEVTILPPTVNYPLHLHSRVPVDRRVRDLQQLETCRYESALDRADWADRIDVSEELRAWIEARRRSVGVE